MRVCVCVCTRKTKHINTKRNKRPSEERADSVAAETALSSRAATRKGRLSSESSLTSSAPQRIYGRLQAGGGVPWGRPATSFLSFVVLLCLLQLFFARLRACCLEREDAVITASVDRHDSVKKGRERERSCVPVKESPSTQGKARPWMSRLGEEGKGSERRSGPSPDRSPHPARQQNYPDDVRGRGHKASGVGGDKRPGTPEKRFQ